MRKALPWLFVAACPWLPGMQDSLRGGGSTILLLWLVCHGGAIGTALAGWCKPFAWAAGIRNYRQLILAVSATGLVGLALAGPHLSAWTGWIPLVQQMRDLAGSTTPLWVTALGMVACVVLGWRRADPAVIMAVGLMASPVRWEHYLLAVWLAMGRLVCSSRYGSISPSAFRSWCGSWSS